MESINKDVLSSLYCLNYADHMIKFQKNPFRYAIWGFSIHEKYKVKNFSSCSVTAESTGLNQATTFFHALERKLTQDMKGLYWYLYTRVYSTAACDDTCVSSLSFTNLPNHCLTVSISSHSNYDAHYERTVQHNDQ